MILFVFLTVLLTTRFVSLSSMLAGISYPIFLNLVLQNANETLMVYSVLVAILLIVTHKKNIVRLFKRQESKVVLFKRA